MQPQQPLPAQPQTEKGSEMSWQVETDIGVLQPHTALDILKRIDQKVQAGQLDGFRPMATGFQGLDEAFNGGVRAGDLVLMGGPQGIGKTTMAFQMARNMAASNAATALYVCYEHDETYLLSRLISMESVDLTSPTMERGVRTKDIQRLVVERRGATPKGLLEILSEHPPARQALAKIKGYGHRLFILKGSAAHTNLPALSRLLGAYRHETLGRLVLFVDYLQKVPIFPEPDKEEEKVTRVVEGLKELAMVHDIPVISIVAADKEGLKAKRLRAHHLRGSSALTYEADIILMLNEKYRIVTKTAIEYNPHKAQSFHNWVVVSVEKNRGGRDFIDLEFQRVFDYHSFDVRGHPVQEQLIEERVFTD